MSLKFANQIVDEATEEQIERWHRIICDGKWPTDMPIPHEATEAVWVKLHSRAINPPTKDPKEAK